MARTPIGERAMTSTERSRRRRLRLKKGLGDEKASLARSPRSPSEWAQIRAEYEARRIVVIDARCRDAYIALHIPAAVSFPHREMNSETTARLNRGKAYVVY